MGVHIMENLRWVNSQRSSSALSVFVRIPMQNRTGYFATKDCYKYVGLAFAQPYDISVYFELGEESLPLRQPLRNTAQILKYLD
jgi:hypothetical protein